MSAARPSRDERIDRRNARLYILGLGATVLGDSALSLVAGIWVKTLTGSSATAGLVSVCVYAPSLLAPVGGLLADRVRRKRLLVTVNAVMAGVVLSLVAVRSPAQLWLIFVVMTLYGSALLIAEPAETALFVTMLPMELRQRLNGLRLTLTEGGKLTAPLFGVGLFALAGGGPVAVLDAVTFCIAALATSRLRVDDERPGTPAGPPQTWRRDLTAGFAQLRRLRVPRAVVTAGAVTMAVSALGVAAQYSLVDALGRSPSFNGVLTGLLGAGSIVAGLTSSAMIDRLGEYRLALVGLSDFAAGSALRATGRLPAALAGSLVLGFALPWIVLAVVNLTQRTTPDALQGRVSAAVTLALFAPQPVFQALGAALIGPLGYRVVFLVLAGAAVLTAIGLRARGSRIPVSEISDRAV